MNGTFVYIAGSFFWGVVSRILDAIIKFVTIPLLINYFGKDDYGILTLAIATNTYMQLLDLGLNTGAVKHISQWIIQSRYRLIYEVARTSITFYLFIGILNSLIFVLLVIFGGKIFNIDACQLKVLKTMLFSMAFFCIINWISSVFNQLLIANENISFIQKIFSMRSIMNLILVFCTIKLNFSLTTYYIIYLFINAIIILPFYYKSRNEKLIDKFLPAFYWKSFLPILKYSLAIFMMSLFQFTAVQSRPIILSIVSSTGVSVLTEYRVIEVFPVFIISIGGMITQILLPKTSKYVEQNKYAEINALAYKGTMYTAILVMLLCIPVMINSKQLLLLYMGPAYTHLSIWLSLWVLAVVLYLHNSPVSSLVLATGKTKILVYSSAFSCFVSILVNVLLIPSLGVGATVVGYLIYVFIQQSFYYLYINNKILCLDSIKILCAFLKPTVIGMCLAFLLILVDIDFGNDLLCVVVRTVIWIILYLLSLYVFKILKLSNVRKMIN